MVRINKETMTASQQAPKILGRRTLLGPLATVTVIIAIGGLDLFTSSSTKKIYLYMTPIDDPGNLDHKERFLKMLNQTIADLKVSEEKDTVRLLEIYLEDFVKNGVLLNDLEEPSSLTPNHAITSQTHFVRDANGTIIKVCPRLQFDWVISNWKSRNNTFGRLNFAASILQEATNLDNYRKNPGLDQERIKELTRLAIPIQESIRRAPKNILLEQKLILLSQNDDIFEKAKRYLAIVMHSEYIGHKALLEFLHKHGLNRQTLEDMHKANLIPKELEYDYISNMTLLNHISNESIVNEYDLKREIVDGLVKALSIKDLLVGVFGIIKGRQWSYNPNLNAYERVDYSDPFDFLTDKKYYK